MIKNRPAAVAALIATAVATGTVIAAPAMAADTPPAKSKAGDVTRIAGADRYTTAINASKADFPTAGSAQSVVIARGDLYVDALAGTPLAAKNHASLLLTESKTLTPGVADEIKRVLGATPAADKATKKIVILGGPQAISADVEKSLKALGYTVERVGGPDRYATALGVASVLGAKNAVVATGADFADALSAGPLAAAAPDSAIVLSNGDKVLDANTAAFIKKAGTVTSVGKPAVTAVNALNVKDTELAGEDRYATAAAVAGSTTLKGSKTAVVATGADFADPLVGGVYAAYNHGALLLTDGKALSPATAKALTGFATPLANVAIFGGEQAVSADVAKSVEKVLSGTYDGYVQGLKDAVAKAQTAADTAQADKLKAATAYPTALGTALVGRDKAIAALPAGDLKTAQAKLNAATKDDKAVQSAFGAYTDAVKAAGPTATPAQQKAVIDTRYALDTAIHGSKATTITAAQDQVDTLAAKSDDAGVKAAETAIDTALKNFEAAGKASQAADEALAAAKKALADATK